MSTRKLALIGTGMMGKLHARVIGQSMQAELVRVVDPNEEAARPVVEQHGAEWTPEIGSLTGVDGVIVASATETHHKLALEVIALGKPVLVEKPLCGSLAETKEVLATAERQGVPLMCGLLERYNPAVLTAKALLEEPIHVIAQRHSPYAPRIKTGVAWDLLVHDVDLAIQMFGGATPVHTIAEAGYFHPESVEGAEDTVDAVLKFERGLATVSASRVGQRKVRSMVISELERLIELDLLRRDVTIYKHISHEGPTTGAPAYKQQTVIEIPQLTTIAEPLATQLDRFLELIDGKIDIDGERKSILPSHEVVADVLEQTH
jgi:predicted dehydrogenase